jgi:cardiolipin-specific phospholipase
LSVAYYERYPQHVEKLILLSPVGLPENPNKDGEKEIIPQGDPAFTRGNADYDGLEEPTTEFRPAGAPRRKMPGWIGHVWDWNLTPQWLVRASGPLGSRLVGGYVQRRMNHLPEEERATFHKYMYHITTLSGSGEYSLAHLLAPGAFARKPLMTRLANVRVPVTFIYGELDWMDYRHAAVASKRMDVPTKIERIPAGGHHMYLENAAEFDRAFGEAVLLS